MQTRRDEGQIAEERARFPNDGYHSTLPVGGNKSSITLSDFINAGGRLDYPRMAERTFAVSL